MVVPDNIELSGRVHQRSRDSGASVWAESKFDDLLKYGMCNISLTNVDHHPVTDVHDEVAIFVSLTHSLDGLGLRKSALSSMYRSLSNSFRVLVRLSCSCRMILR